MVSPVRYSQDPQLVQALRLRGAELLRFGDEQQKAIGASLLQWVEEQGGYEAALAASELCKGGAESKRGCGSVERVVGGSTQVMQNLDLGDVALLAGVGLVGQMTRNRVMGWMGRRVESWWNRGKPATLLAKGAGVTTEVMGITGIGVAHKVKAGQPVNVGEEFFHTGIGWLGLRLGMGASGVLPKAIHQWGRHDSLRLAGAMGFTRVTSAFVGGTVGMVAVGQDVYQAATTQAQFMVGMRGVYEFIPAYGNVATRLHTQGKFLASVLDANRYREWLKTFQFPDFSSTGMKPLLVEAGSGRGLSEKGGFRAYSEGDIRVGKKTVYPQRALEWAEKYDEVFLAPFRDMPVSKAGMPDFRLYLQPVSEKFDKIVIVNPADLTNSMKHILEAIANLDHQQPKLHLMVQDASGARQAICEFSFSRLASGEFQLVNHLLYVAPEARGRGLGFWMEKMSLGAALELAAQNNAALVVVREEVRNRNLAIRLARSNYEAVSYDPEGTSHSYVIKLFPTQQADGAARLAYAKEEDFKAAMEELNSWKLFAPPTGVKPTVDDYGAGEWTKYATPDVIFETTNPTNFFREAFPLFFRWNHFGAMIVRIQERGEELGYGLFKVFQRHPYPNRITLYNIYIYKKARGQGRFNQVAKPLLATAMAAWKGQGHFELVFLGVVNSGLRNRFVRAGLEKVEEVPYTDDEFDIPRPRESASYKLKIPLAN
ncbi:MAG: hypothetical protein HYU97_11275 [Deltaproteobacteria bacterium]|nr:hypothetical protein [Deltaproteobacteria bacterium]